MRRLGTGYLGGFSLQDGYGNFLSEVRQTNEGQYGTNNGGPGGSQAAITPGTGLWYGIAGTMYPSNFGGATAYATGHSGYQMTGSQGLVITTNCEGWGGNTLKYGYRLDLRDLNGAAPAATAGQVVNISFWTTVPDGTGEGGGVTPGTIGYTVEFVDSAGNVGFSVGVHQPATTTDYVAFKNTGSYTLTSIAASGVYSRWDIKLDLVPDGDGELLRRIHDQHHHGSVGVLLAAPMSNLDRLFFESSSGVNNAKTWSVDDFGMHTTCRARWPCWGWAWGFAAAAHCPVSHARY